VSEFCFVLLKRASGASKVPKYHEILAYTRCEEEVRREKRREERVKNRTFTRG